MWENHNLRRQRIATCLVSAAAGWYFLFDIGIALAQAPGCPCTFKEAPWEAYGTKAACTTITRKSGTSCEVEFGGLGADPKIAAQVLGLDPAVYTRNVYETVGLFLQYLKDNNREALANPKFLSTAVPMFMRGAYLRTPRGDFNLSQVQSLDSAIIIFSEKYSDLVSKVFLGGASEFSTTIGDANFTVGRGYITVKHPFGLLITRYMPAE
ncbi:hypothetical protein ACVW1C_003326 [Bradyrhizobium sp. USDA 4011]